MIDVIYQKKFLKVNQIWYPGKRTVESLLKEKRKADILFVHGAPIEEKKEASGAGRNIIPVEMI